MLVESKATQVLDSIKKQDDEFNTFIETHYEFEERDSEVTVILKTNNPYSYNALLYGFYDYIEEDNKIIILETNIKEVVSSIKSFLCLSTDYDWY